VFIDAEDGASALRRFNDRVAVDIWVDVTALTAFDGLTIPCKL
jgi:hypothetical protein